MSKVMINGKEYQCHSYCEKDVKIGLAIELILEGTFKPNRGQLVILQKSGIKHSGSLVLYHNYGEIAKLSLFVEE